MGLQPDAQAGSARRHRPQHLFISDAGRCDGRSQSDRTVHSQSRSERTRCHAPWAGRCTSRWQSPPACRQKRCCGDRRPRQAPHVSLPRRLIHGVGISPEARAHLFEPFFTTKRSWRQLGSAWLRFSPASHQSGGFIVVDSPASGAALSRCTFRRRLKLFNLSRLSPEFAEAPETILLVEDEDSVRVIVGAVASAAGVSGARGGSGDRCG